MIHCAARIIVPESIDNPYLYYRENVSKTLEFIHQCEKNDIKNFIFSSSASVYRDNKNIIVDEDAPCRPASPYAHSKLMVERMLESICSTGKLRGISLRYFNPIGADPKLRTGSYVKNGSNLLAQLVQAHKDPMKQFEVFGTDWPTRDGTGIRDFIHVWDLAYAHLAALDFLEEKKAHTFYDVVNLGTGRGTTVGEFVDAFQACIGNPIKAAFTERRKGDVAGVCASGRKALILLGWKDERSIAEGIKDALKWDDLYNLPKSSFDSTSQSQSAIT